ncbi:MAG: GIY-YIG nuclease family protein [Clostridiales bacterium]|nr:GIY-YIG nuclease family protein [Clostridiales bacterium]
MYYIYILTNKTNSVLYTGVTNDLTRRIEEHKQNLIPNSFTARYNVHKLVFYETTSDIKVAIEREKQIKSGSRKKKIELINQMNPEWNDLSKLF